MLPVLEQILGIVLGLAVLLDIFLLVLHVRADTGIISQLISYPVWRGFIALSHSMGRGKGTFLSFAGPLIVVLILAAWFLLLTLAAALIVHPTLGTAIRATHGETPRDFVTALYVGAHSLTFVGGSDFAPHTPASRLYYLIASIIGVALVPLIVTYLLEVYASLRSRNALGLQVHLDSAETGDAAETIAGMGPQGRFDMGYMALSQWAAESVQVKESHHFHPVLFYFRFKEPYYSVSRTSLVSLDTVSLIKSALDEEQYGWLKKSTALEQLQLANVLELKTLLSAFVPGANKKISPDEATRSRWRQRYRNAVERLRQAGIKTSESGVEEYVSLRSQWDWYIIQLAPKFGFEMEEVDTALAKTA